MGIWPILRPQKAADDQGWLLSILKEVLWQFAGLVGMDGLLELSLLPLLC